MSILILPVLFFLIIYLDQNSFSSKKEKNVYRFLALIAILLSIPVSFALQLDHVGASLSGMVSLFTN